MQRTDWGGKIREKDDEEDRDGKELEMGTRF